MADSPFDPELTAAELCADIDIGEEAAALLDETILAGEYFAALRAAEHRIDAIRVLARAMTKPRAVRWAFECAEPTADDDGLELLETARVWLEDQSEENRRTAFDAAEASGYETSCAWVAAATAWTGGSLAPADVPVVPPAESLTAKAASGAICIAAAADPEKVAPTQDAFLDLGLKIAGEPEAAPEALAAEEPPVNVVAEEPPAPVVTAVKRRPEPAAPSRPTRRPPPSTGGWSPEPL